MSSSIQKNNLSNHGINTRYNWFEMSRVLDLTGFQLVEQQAKSVACLVNHGQLITTQDQSSTEYKMSLHVMSLAQKLQDEKYGSHKKIKAEYNGPFGEEKSLGIGTAFLVGKQLILTACHCVADSSNKLYSREQLEKILVVFDFYVSQPNPTEITFNSRQVYHIQHLWKYENTNRMGDWAVLRLDREVEEREPINLASSNPFALNTELYMLGHPMGLPLKLTLSGTIKEDIESKFFKTDLDAFRGNSGSPIFSKNSGALVGMLLAGGEDYTYNTSPDNVFVKIIKEREAEEYQECHKIASIDFLKTVLTSSFKMAHTNFSGRRKYLNQLKQLVATSEQATILIYGPGGVGKSELATCFANENLQAFSFIWQIPCGTEEEQYLGYLELAKRLNVTVEKESVQDLIDRIHYQLEQSSGKPWLLILDNVEKPFTLPARGGSILITSRTKLNIHSVKPLEVSPMDLREALELLTYVTQSPADECQKLLDKVGCYPLILGQVSAFIRQTGISIEDYLKEFEEHHGVSTLDTILKITLSKLPPKAQQWLYCSAFLNPACIPVSYLEGWLKNFTEEKAVIFDFLKPIHVPDLVSSLVNHTREKTAILDVLEHHALLRPSEDRQSFSLHVELQKILRGFSLPETLRQLSSVLAQQSKTWCFENTTDWAKTMKDASLWASHAEVLVQAIQGRLPKNLDQAVILTSLGAYQTNAGNYSKTLKYRMEALELFKTLLGPSHPDVAATLNDVGTTLRDLGQYEEALKYQMEALELFKTLLGPSHPDVAASLNNIGLTLSDLGRNAEALNYLKEVLELQRTLLGPSHPKLAVSLNNVGRTLRALGEYEEALKYLKDALELDKTLLGSSHPLVARNLSNVGLTLGNLNRNEEALRYLKEALELQRTLLGPSHPDVAGSLINMGLVLGNLKRHEEALKYQMEALELFKTLLGPSHPYVALSLNNIGSTLGALWRHEEALKYLKEALELRKILVGPSHPDVAGSLNNVGSTLEDLGRHEEALKYQMEALELFKALLGPSHSHALLSLSSVCNTLGELGRHEEALRYKIDMLELRKALLGPEHPNVGKSLNSLSITLGHLGRHIEAFALKQEALELLVNALGSNHPDAAASLDIIASIAEDMGLYEQALEWKTMLLELRKKILGPRHPDVATSLNSMSITYDVLKRHKQALECKMMALEIRKEALGSNHPDVAQSASDVGASYFKKRDYVQALDYFTQALEIRLSVFKENHSSVIEARDNIKLCQEKIDRKCSIS